LLISSCVIGIKSTTLFLEKIKPEVSRFDICVPGITVQLVNTNAHIIIAERQSFLKVQIIITIRLLLVYGRVACNKTQRSEYQVINFHRSNRSKYFKFKHNLYS